MLNKLFSLFLVLGFIIGNINSSPFVIKAESDSWSRDRIVMLRGMFGLCTGFEVIAPSGKIYTVSAAHCAGLAVGGYIMAINESGERQNLRVLEVHKDSDIMILDGYGYKAFTVASHVYVYSEVHAMGHGGGLLTYRGDGVMLDLVETNIEHTGVKRYEIASVMVIGGCSGGPLLNNANEVVGITSFSQTGTNISGFVRLDDIKAALSRY